MFHDSSNVGRLILLNQSAGELFVQLAEGLSRRYKDGCLLVSSESAAVISAKKSNSLLEVHVAPLYDRGTKLRRVCSGLRYTLFITRYIVMARASDAVLVSSNPPFCAFWVWLLTYLRRIPYAVLVYDIYPDVLIGLGMLRRKGLAAQAWKLVNRCVFRRAEVVVTIGNRMATIIKRQLGEDDAKVVVVPPWVDVNSIRPLSRAQNSHADAYVPNGTLVVLYSGNMGLSHDIDSILEAARLLRKEKDIFFLLIGGGEKFLKAAGFAARHGLTNLRVLPWQPAERVPYTLALADISLVAMDEGMEDFMLPSKTFSYLAAGSAIVAITSGPSELTDIIDQASVGLYVSARQPSHLASAIRALAFDKPRLKAMRAEARRLAVERYSREAGLAAFVQVLEEAMLGP